MTAQKSWLGPRTNVPKFCREPLPLFPSRETNAQIIYQETNAQRTEAPNTCLGMITWKWMSPSLSCTTVDYGLPKSSTLSLSLPLIPKATPQWIGQSLIKICEPSFSWCHNLFQRGPLLHVRWLLFMDAPKVPLSLSDWSPGQRHDGSVNLSFLTVSWLCHLVCDQNPGFGIGNRN